MFTLATFAACHEITLNPDRVVALEIVNTTPRVPAGDTLRLNARALNASGQTVTGAVVTWTTIDTGVVAFQLDPSGLVTGTSPGVGRVEAVADALRSDPITVTVIAPASGVDYRPPLPVGRGDGVRDGTGARRG